MISKTCKNVCLLFFKYIEFYKIWIFKEIFYKIYKMLIQSKFVNKTGSSWAIFGLKYPIFG